MNYVFDALDRLTGENSVFETLGYAYDANGNRLARTENDKSTTYSYTPDSNRMIKINKKQDLTLDAAGNTVSDRAGKRLFNYDSAGNLKQLTFNGEVRGSYAYNFQHQRTRKVKKNGAVFQYHYDLDGRLLAESRNGQPWKDYVWVEDEPVTQIRVHKNAKGKLLVKDIVYLTSDHLDTPRIGTDANAEVVWRWEGDAFGDTKTESDPDEDDKNVAVNLRFPGQYFDAETGLHYNWHRYYDPRTGRYINSDPIGLFAGLNTYAYVGNNPPKWSDPWGLWSTEGHHYYLNRKFKDTVSSEALKALKAGSDFADKFFPHQLPGWEHMHALVGEGLTVAQAKERACLFFKKRIWAYELNLRNGRVYDAYFSLGMALHVVMDSTAPVHQWRRYSLLTDGRYHGDMPESRETLEVARQPYYEAITLDAMRNALEEEPDFCGCRK